MTDKIKLIWTVLIFVVIVFAVVFLSFVPDLIYGRSNLQDIKKAAILAKKNTPLYAMSHTELSPPMPMMLVVYGKDKNGKKLAVFIDKRHNVRGYVYLDHGISSEKATDIALHAGQFKGPLTSVKLGRSGENSFYWYIVADNETDHLEAVIDFKTGKIINIESFQKPNN